MMRMRNIRRPLTTLVAVAALIAAGCIVSGQFVIVIPWSGDIETTDSDVGSLMINLASNSTWDDHSDEIQDIVDLKFECKVINNVPGTTATGEVWISPTSVGTDPKAADVRAHPDAILFLSGIEVAHGTPEEIGFKESSAYITNLAEVLDIIEDGVFYIYGIATTDPFDITITGVEGQARGRIMVTFSAG